MDKYSTFHFIFIINLFLYNKLKAIKAFEGTVFPFSEKVLVVSRIFHTNTANVSSANGIHEFLVVFVFFSFGFSFFLCLPEPRINDPGVEIAIETTISHVKYFGFDEYFCI